MIGKCHLEILSQLEDTIWVELPSYQWNTKEMKCGMAGASCKLYNDYDDGENRHFHTRNIWRSLSKGMALLLDEKKIIFFWKKRHLKWTVILLSSLNKSFFLNHLFKVIWKVNIFIILLFSCLITCILHFSYYCYLKLCGLKWFGAWVITRHIRFRGSMQVMAFSGVRVWKIFFFVKDEKKRESLLI